MNKKEIENVAGRFITSLGDFKTVLCVTCIHKNNDRTCKAFPKSIPKEILAGEIDHKKPYKDDHGIQYKKVKL